MKKKKKFLSFSPTTMTHQKRTYAESDSLDYESCKTMSSRILLVTKAASMQVDNLSEPAHAVSDHDAPVNARRSFRFMDGSGIRVIANPDADELVYRMISSDEEAIRARQYAEYKQRWFTKPQLPTGTTVDEHGCARLFTDAEYNAYIDRKRPPVILPNARKGLTRPIKNTWRPHTMARMLNYTNQ
jgi:hypothetical protein